MTPRNQGLRLPHAQERLSRSGAERRRGRDDRQSRRLGGPRCRQRPIRDHGRKLVLDARCFQVGSGGRRPRLPRHAAGAPGAVASVGLWGAARASRRDRGNRFARCDAALPRQRRSLLRQQRENQDAVKEDSHASSRPRGHYPIGHDTARVQRRFSSRTVLGRPAQRSAHPCERSTPVEYPRLMASSTTGFKSPHRR